MGAPGAHLQWLGPQSLLQYSPSQSGFWPCTGVGPPGDWEPPTLFWYSAWMWENPCQSEGWGWGMGVRRLAIDLSRIHIPAGGQISAAGLKRRRQEQRLFAVTACVSESHRLFILNISISAAQQHLANTLTAATRLALKLTSAISRPCVSYIVYVIKM